MLWRQRSETGAWWDHWSVSVDRGLTWWSFHASPELTAWWMSAPLLRRMPPLIYPGKPTRMTWRDGLLIVDYEDRSHDQHDDAAGRLTCSN